MAKGSGLAAIMAARAKKKKGALVEGSAAEEATESAPFEKKEDAGNDAEIAKDAIMRRLKKGG